MSYNFIPVKHPPTVLLATSSIVKVLLSLLKNVIKLLKLKLFGIQFLTYILKYSQSKNQYVFAS